MTAASGRAPDGLHAIADQLDDLGRALRAVAGDVARDTQGPIRRGDSERRDARPAERLDAEVDRALTQAGQAIDRSVATALQTIVEAEREARERILATTESVCARIEAVDRAQERVAEALGRLEPPAAGDAVAGDQ